MKSALKLAGALVLAAAAACGQDRGADGLSGEEREKLNTLAEQLDNEADVVDASPDSLVANDGLTAAETGEEAATDNAADANAQ